MISITVDFVDRGKFDKFIRYIENNLIYAEAQEEIRVLGHHCADNMIDTIESSRKNPDRGTHKLENAIIAETLSTTAGVEVGVGRISKLQQEAPYFEMINDGFTYTTRQTHVVPTDYFANKGTGFITFKEGSKHTIEGIQYVFKAIQKLEIELRDFIIKVGGKYLDGLSKT